MSRERLVGLLVVFLVVTGGFLLWRTLSTSHPTTVKKKTAIPPRRTVTSTPPGKQALLAKYRAAIVDSSRPSEKKRVHALWALTRSTTSLRWKKFDGKEHLLVVTWTGFSGYPKAGSAYKTPAKFDIWVTPAPQMQQFCRSLSSSTRDLRLKQWLGLNPTRSKQWVVEFWVPVDKLFRPCSSPSTKTTSCPLHVPDNVSKEHREWLKGQKKWAWHSKPLEKGAPWTNLGYTYDWGGSKFPFVGASEYVMQRNVSVRIHRILKTGEYCSSKTP